MPIVLPLRSGHPRRIGRYRLTGRLEPGVEGFPGSFLGRSAEGEQVTLTPLGGERAADGAARDRFTAEAAAARRVEPFCVGRILGAVLEDSEPYLVREYVPGVSLAEAAADDGPLTDESLAGLAIGTATGLVAIHHAGLVHGAFGPENVVLSPDGPRVVQFSVTPPYGSATPAADMLAWALTMVFAAVGRQAVGPQDLTALPEGLREVVAKCLAPDPAARPAAPVILTRLLGRDEPSADLLAEGARRARSAARAISQDASPGGVLATRQPRSRAVTWVAACAACLAVLAAAGWFLLGRPGGSRASMVTASSSGTSAPATRPPSVPAGMTGTWRGQVRQTAPVLAVTVRITLAGGSPRGTIDYPALGCYGRLRAVSGAAGALTLALHITQGRQSCNDGVITLTAHGPGQLAFSFHRSSGPNPGGVLTRVQASPSPSPS